LKPDKKRGNTSLHQRLEKPKLFYGWIIAAVAFPTVADAYWVRYSFSVFYVEILETFGWSISGTRMGIITDDGH
jgi:hypothetical protein